MNKNWIAYCLILLAGCSAGPPGKPAVRNESEHRQGAPSNTPPVVLHSGTEEFLNRAARVAVDESAVYWVESDDNSNPAWKPTRIVRWEKTNGVAIPVPAGQSAKPIAEIPDKYVFIGDLTFNGTSLYWTEHVWDPSGPRSCIRRVLREGGSVETLVQSKDIAHFVIAEDTLYWTEGGDTWSQVVPLVGGIKSLDLKTRRETTLLWGIKGAYALAVGGDFVYFSALAKWHGNGTTPTGNVYKLPRGGGEQVLLSADEKGPRILQLRGNSLYWLNNNSTTSDSSITRMDLKTQQTTRVTVDYFQVLVADADTLYFSGWSTIYRQPVAGGEPQVLVDWKGEWSELESMAIDDRAVYWTTNHGEVRMAPKK